MNQQYWTVFANSKQDLVSFLQKDSGLTKSYTSGFTGKPYLEWVCEMPMSLKIHCVHCDSLYSYTDKTLPDQSMDCTTCGNGLIKYTKS